MEHFSCRKICKNISSGYAYHKVIFDDYNKPIDYRFLEVNPSFETMTGLGADIVGKSIKEILPDIIDDKFDWIKFYGEISLSKERKVFRQYSQPLKKWYQITAYSIETGTFVTLVEDIQDEVETHKDLNDLLEMSGAFRWEVDFNGLYTSIYGCQKTFFGYKTSDIIGIKSIYDLHPIEGRDQFKHNAFEIFRKKGTFEKLESVIETSNGDLRYVLISGTPILNAKGDLLGYKGIDLDVTKQRQLEHELKSKVLKLNKTREELTNRNKELGCLYSLTQIINTHQFRLDLIAQESLNIVPAAFKHSEITVVKILLDGGEYTQENFQLTPWLLEENIYCEDQEFGKITICYLEDKVFLPEEKGLIKVISDRLGKAVCRIKIMQKNQEAAKQLYHSSKLASLGELAASIGHEINNPLSIIFGTIDMLKHRRSEEIQPFMSSIDVIAQSCSRIQNLVSGLRTYARLDSEEITPIDMHEIIEQTLMLTEVIYQKENINIHRIFNARRPHINGNGGKIQQVLMNLLVNARDALKDNNDGEITISTRNEGDDFILSFTDNGPGIGQEVKEKIFESFYTTKPIGKGTGLGLSISKKIISSMNGEISVESEIGEGATFLLKLPISNANLTKKENNNHCDDTFKINETLNRPTALVVDDELGLRSIIVNIIKKMGFETTEAKDGQEALEILKQQKFDYLITDIKMPRIDGLKLIEAVRENSYTDKIVVISGGILFNDQELLESKCDAVIRKPFKSSDIYEAINSIQTQKTE